MAVMNLNAGDQEAVDASLWYATEEAKKDRINPKGPGYEDYISARAKVIRDDTDLRSKAIDQYRAYKEKTEKDMADFNEASRDGRVTFDGKEITVVPPSQRPDTAPGEPSVGTQPSAPPQPPPSPAKGRGTMTPTEVIQAALHRGGYDTGKFGKNHDGVDNDFGPKTSKAYDKAAHEAGLSAEEAAKLKDSIVAGKIDPNDPSLTKLSNRLARKIKEHEKSKDAPAVAEELANAKDDPTHGHMKSDNKQAGHFVHDNHYDGHQPHPGPLPPKQRPAPGAGASR